MEIEANEPHSRADAARQSVTSRKRQSLHSQAALSFAGKQADSQDGITEVQVVMSLVTAMVGAGVVALPSLMQAGGYVMAVVLALFTGICFMEVGCFMHDTLSRVENSATAESRVRSFDDFGDAAMGEMGVKMVQASVTLMFFGYMVVYQVLIGQNLRILLPMDVCDKPSVASMMMAAFPVLCGLALLKDMSSLAKLMPLGTFVAIMGCVLICYKGLADSMLRTDEWRDLEVWETLENNTHVGAPLYNTWPPNAAGLGTVIAVLFAAFAVMGTVPTIRGQMRNTQAFPFAFRATVAGVVFLYIACMACAYYGYGNFIKSNVVQSMSYFPADLEEAREAILDGDSDFTGMKSPLIGNTMALMVVINLLISFPVYFQCIIGSVERLSPEASWAQFGSPGNTVLRISVVLITSIAGMIVPYFKSMLAILASVCCSCNNVFFPLVFAYKLNAGIVQVGPARKLFHALIMLFATVCLFLGFYDAVSGLVAKMRNPPPADGCAMKLLRNMTTTLTTTMTGTMPAALALK